MSLLLKISPSFIKELDRRLRVNLPWVWATRIHLNLFWGLVLGVLFAMIGLIYQVDERSVIEERSLENLFMILCIPSTILGVFSIYQLALFNDEKSYGKHFFGKETLTFIIYFITFIIPLVIPFSTTYVINRKIAGILTHEELKSKGYDLKYGQCYFPTERYQYAFYTSDYNYLYSQTNSDKYSSLAKNKSMNEVVNAFYAKYAHQFTRRNGESRIADSVFYGSSFFESHKIFLYRNINNSGGALMAYDYEMKRMGIDFLSDSLLRDFIFRRNLDHDESIAMEKINRFIPLLYQFSYVPDNISAELILDDYRNNRYANSYSYRYLQDKIDQVEENMGRIARAKMYKADFFSPIIFIGFGIAGFLIAMLYSIYKNVNWKQLLLGVGALAVIAAIFGVIEGVGQMHGKFILTASQVVFWILIILSIRTYGLRRKNVFVIQSVIILNLTVIFFPILTLFFLDEICGFYYWSIFDSYLIPNNPRLNLDMQYYGGMHNVGNYVYEYQQLKSLIKICTNVAGFVLYFVFWHSYFKRLYLKLWALPSNK